MSKKILCLGDMHIGRKRNKEEENNIQVIVKTILRDHSDADVILLAGDVVNDGRKSQYKVAKNLLLPLMEKFKVWGVPGNHDYGWKGNHAKKKRFKHFKNMMSPLENIRYPHVKQDKDNNVYIGLNSMLEETDGFDGWLADGELGERQLEDLDGILGKLEDRPESQRVLINLHHHPFLFPDDSPVEKAGEKFGHWLKDGDDLMSIISNMRVDVLIFAHEHRHLNFSETKLSDLYGIPWILAAGKCTKRTTEYKADNEGKAIKKDENGDHTKDYIHKDKLLGYEIIIDDTNISPRSIAFD